MLADPHCPGCSGFNWRVIGSKCYSRSGAEQRSRYVQKRLDVLFNVWFPMCSQVTISSLLCQRCGLVIYSPRPEAADLDAKYRYLNEHSSGSSRLPDPGLVSSIDRARAEELYRAVSRLSGRRIRGLSVLDYGGGDGRLMQPFLAAGCRCDLIDHSETSIAGVQRIGSTLADCDTRHSYDLIIASHVIEHLAEPLDVLKGLAARLAPQGALYVEVPMEIWGQAPLQPEPVTHVNFFTTTSLAYLLEAAGLPLVECRFASSLHSFHNGSRFAAIKAVATKGRAAAAPSLPGVGEAATFLSSHPLRRALCAARFPRVVLSVLRRRWLPGRLRWS